MKIFKDIFTGDELASDTQPIEVINDVVYKIQSKMVTKTDSGEYNIGANPSQDAENPPEEDSSVDPTTVTVNLIADNHKLQQTSFDKKSFMAYIKSYMKRLLEKLKAENPARAEIFQKNVQSFVKTVLDNFSDYDFWTGESMDLEAMVILMSYGEDGMTPYFYLFKDGIIEEKV